jgi:hypothetical protein
MNNHKSLIFFNKEGDSLNFSYNESTDLIQGDILFHENSTDTFKTYGLYMMENIPSFEFDSPGELTSRRFQLFNEKGINFYGSSFKSQKIDKIEPVNNDPDFYSKWIYGSDFESKFPIGSLIRFDETIFEFDNKNITYVVVSSKKNAIMIISYLDNSTFNLKYFPIYENETSYLNKTLSGVNAIGINDYIDDDYNSNLSNWNETEFYDILYKDKKLNIVNSRINDSIVTVDNTDTFDQVHVSYNVSSFEIPDNSDLIIEVSTKTDVPMIFDGNLNIQGNKILLNNYPQILKPGTIFKIVGSQNNKNFITVSSIPRWEGIFNETFFEAGFQVQFQNIIYECVSSYTQSFSNNQTSFLTPDNSEFWSTPSYISTKEVLFDEVIKASLYLTTDIYQFKQEWTSSSISTMKIAAEKFKSDISLFNIELSYKDEKIEANLPFPSNYAIVNFYYETSGNLNKIGGTSKIIERIIEVKENIKYEINKNYSENFKYNIVFTDIDRFGFKIVINEMVYDIEAVIIFSGASIDMERTIDRTLRNWFNKYYIDLYKLGIDIDIENNNSDSFFYNSIVLKTQYPNVPINIDSIEVGTTADFYIDNISVIFNEIGPFLNISINENEFSILPVYEDEDLNIVDIEKTLEKWISEYTISLLSIGIRVDNIRNILYFRTKILNKNFNIRIDDGLGEVVDKEKNIIIRKNTGNYGCLISSNELLLPNDSLESFTSTGFATGMVTSINNSFWVLNNKEYNITYLSDNIINLDYRGPFWGMTSSPLSLSPFKTLSFNDGFSKEFLGLSEWSGFTFSNDFTTTFNPNTYSVSTFEFTDDIGLNFIDIQYIKLTGSIYSLSETHLVISNALNSDYIDSIELLGNSDSIKIVFNNINNFIYSLSRNRIWIIDPIKRNIYDYIDINNNSFDININKVNGDVYVTYSDSPSIDIWSFDNFTGTSSYTIDENTDLNFPTGASSSGKMVFNDFEQSMYINLDNEFVIRVSSNRVINKTYQIPSLEKDSIYYEPINEGIYIYGNSLWKIVGNESQQISSIPSLTFSSVIFNNITGSIDISDSSNFYKKLSIEDDSLLQYELGRNGHITINQFDECVYLSTTGTQSEVSVIDNGIEINRISFNSNIIKMIYNPERKSIWGIQPSSGSIIEIRVFVAQEIDNNIISESVGENLFGTLSDGYQNRVGIWLKTRDYFRKPRENFIGNVRVQYYWRWLSDDVPDIFMYDFSGEQLPIGDEYSYVGKKPLDKIILNRNPNKDLDKIERSEYQQTIFDRIVYNLPYINDPIELGNNAEPIQLFLGFKSETEGVVRSELQLFKKEQIMFDILSDIDTILNLRTEQIDNDRFGVIEISSNSMQIFSGRGLRPGQKIAIYLNDQDNITNQYTSDNNASVFIIRQVFTKTIILDFIKNTDFLFEESTFVDNYPSSGKSTYLKLKIKVLDKELARFKVVGQTEDEDERFRVELGNLGKLIAPDEVFIFKKYDILEGGIDWTFLNKKRKEMLMMKHLIYPYIGSYKSIINAINYFGYNDLQLNEYYRNIDPESENFFKLFKVEIPNIFDNSVDGWVDNDIIKDTLPNNRFEETNLFNLTYQITNKEGDNILEYSIDEVLIKLQGLKYWLKRNIIPLTHKIMDITGKSYLNSTTSITHNVKDINIINIKQEMSPVTFKLNEAYLMPINSGSTVYNCVLDFYSIIRKENLPEDIKPFNGSKLEEPESFNIKIRTYKTYKEWNPFFNYKTGDKIIYFDKIYESVINNNRTNNPRKFNSFSTWSPNIKYKVSTVVEYKRDFYVFSGLGDESSKKSPNLDSDNWQKVTEWIEIDKEPVQTINEFRLGDNLLPFNFTIDSNIDPFITISVTSDNGYGQIYSDRKNYEIRGIRDLFDNNQLLGDSIGPFVPITPIYNTP